MVKKLLKVLLILIIISLVTTVNCFAVSLTNEEKFNKDEVDYIKRTYTVSKEDEESFLLNLQNEFKVDNKVFQVENKSKSGGEIVEIIDINTSKSLISNTNKIEDILSLLPQEIKYSKNDFTGKYFLDTNSIDVKSKYNGYKEELVEDTKEYLDLDTNDLDNIPKQIIKDGLVLDLISTKWEVTETRNLQENIIPSKYKAICNYATKKRVDYPLTYIVNAEYSGTAEKVLKQDYIYEITYKCVAEKNVIYPILISTGGIILVLIIFVFMPKKNVTIYNLQDKEWKEIGKQRLRNGKIKLDRYDYKVLSNKFKIVIDDKLVDKYNCKMISIIRQKRVISKFIKKDNNIVPYTIEVII